MHDRWRHFLIFGVYFGLAILITWPLVTVFNTELYGGFLSDSIQSARHTWWIKHALQTGQSIFYQPALGYPDGLYGAWIWANPLEYFPAWLFAFVMPLVAACNLMLLLQLTLNGWAVYWLVYHLTDHKLMPAFIAGVIFLSYPAMQGRIYGGHVGVLALWPLPLYLYALFRLKDAPQPRWYGMAVVFFALSVAGNSTLLVYYLIPTAGLFMLWLMASRQWVWFWRAFRANLGGSALMLVLLVPLALETASVPQYNPDQVGAVRYSADLLSFASPSFYHPLFSRFLDYPNRVLGINLVEGIGYIGLIAAALSLIGLSARKQARWWLMLALVAWVFSLGPLLKIFDEPVRLGVDGYESYVTMPLALLNNLPVVGIARTHGRFDLTVGLAMAVMAGYGASALWERLQGLRWRPVLGVGMAALIVFEYQMFWGMPTITATAPQAVHDLRARDDIRAILTLPYDHPLLAKFGMYHQVFHQQNILGGQFVRDTPANPARLGLLQNTLDLTALAAAGVDVVIWYKERDAQGQMLDALTRRQLGAPRYEDDRLAIFEVPEPGTSAFVAYTPESVTITRETEGYVYVAAPGWVTFSGVLTSDERDIQLFVDEERFNRWRIAQSDTFRLALPFTEAGFHRIRLQADPACPEVENPTLVCNSIQAQALTLGDYLPDRFAQPIAFANEITLEGAAISGDILPGQALPLALWWRFDQPPSEAASRFVHVLNPEGEVIIQADGPLPITQATDWVETPPLMLPPDLAPGTYRVHAGWYSYPSLERFAVMDDVPGAEINYPLIATFEVES